MRGNPVSVIGEATAHGLTGDKRVTFYLALPLEHAETLREVCAHIGGDPKQSRRGLMDNIRDALNEQGIFRSSDENKRASGSMYFGTSRMDAPTVERDVESQKAAVEEWINYAGGDNA